MCFSEYFSNTATSIRWQPTCFAAQQRNQQNLLWNPWHNGWNFHRWSIRIQQPDSTTWIIPNFVRVPRFPPPKPPSDVSDEATILLQCIQKKYGIVYNPLEWKCPVYKKHEPEHSRPDFSCFFFTQIGCCRIDIHGTWPEELTSRRYLDLFGR